MHLKEVQRNCFQDLSLASSFLCLPLHTLIIHNILARMWAAERRKQQSDVGTGHTRPQFTNHQATRFSLSYTGPDNQLQRQHFLVSLFTLQSFQSKQIARLEGSALQLITRTVCHTGRIVRRRLVRFTYGPQCADHRR